jgi:hypothetical protein
MIEIALPPASVAGIITATASALTASGLLVTAIVAAVKFFRPLLRKVNANTAQLSVIHTLVNSTLTAALQSELDATRREALLLRELILMRTDDGKEATEDQRAALGATQRRIDELTVAMQERRTQTRAADLQIETEHRRVAAEG